MNENAEKIASLNDEFRRELLRLNRLRSVPGKTVMTRGVATAPGDVVERLVKEVVGYDAFESGDDPYGERDFGAVEVDGVRYFWKIDYYDLDYEFGSEDPADVSVTRRVLTLMRADEY